MKSLLNRSKQLEPLSHPSRGAWIEMALLKQTLGHSAVAPLTGCVD